MNDAYRQLRRQIAEKEVRVLALESKLKQDWESLSDELKPGRLISSAVHTLANEALGSNETVRDILSMGIVYSADKYLLSKTNFFARAAGLFAIRQFVSTFIEAKKDD
jgi:hypothetical protein